MVEHRASVEVPASAHQVYEMFSHFNDFPKFMTYVKEVTYIDDRTSHWVADLFGTHEWDAVNEDWQQDRRIGWRSTAGLQNDGRVTFTDLGTGATLLDVEIRYDPPGGVLGDIGERFGTGAEFERRLQADLNRFAEMVREAPPGALDPTSSSYLFHAGSAAAEGKTTAAQDATMRGGTGNVADASSYGDGKGAYGAASGNAAGSSDYEGAAGALDPLGAEEASEGPIESVEAVGGSGASGGRAVLPDEFEREMSEKGRSSFGGDDLTEGSVESEVGARETGGSI